MKQDQAISDERILEIAVETRSAEPGRDGYVLPIKFARAILAAAEQPAATPNLPRSALPDEREAAGVKEDRRG